MCIVSIVLKSPYRPQLNAKKDAGARDDTFIENDECVACIWIYELYVCVQLSKHLLVDTQTYICNSSSLL